MVGDWGYVKGDDMGTFATLEMAREVIEREMPVYVQKKEWDGTGGSHSK